ncbi:hypothetical protein ACWT_2382 [Actinoplanes sp. SE50]|nr:hypothetical protein ACPL_2509 [Actinoplanes sp. SE50/110]ATO81797.1 hypothetical protein ACWT_2382 [Actinoplanes sp. SE50]SLL99205.1 hypothetical protein ACSP50_2436 [Actinoplanes sp. SE50/110]
MDWFTDDGSAPMSNDKFRDARAFDLDTMKGAVAADKWDVELIAQRQRSPSGDTHEFASEHPGVLLKDALNGWLSGAGIEDKTS